MGVVTENGTFVGQTLTDAQAYKQFFDLKLEDRDHWRDRLWTRVDAGELSEGEVLDLIIKGTDDNLVTASEEVVGVVRWPVLRIIDGELVSAEFGPLSSYADLSKPDGRLALKQAQALVKYFEKSDEPRQVFYAFSDQACGCFGVTMNYKPDTGEIMAVSKYYPMGVEELGRVFDRLNGEGREIIVIDGEVTDNPLGWQVRVDKEKDFICLEEQEQVIGMVVGDGVTETVVPEFKNPSVWLGWGVGIGMGDVHLGSGHEAVSVTEAPEYEEQVVVVSGVYNQVNQLDREVITESMEVTESTEIFSEVMQPHPRSGVEVVAEKIVAPMVTRMISVNEVIEDTVSHLRGVIKAEVSESTGEVMVPQVTLPDVHLGSGHEDAAVVSSDSVNWAKTHGIPQAEKAEYQERKSVKIEEVITENTEVSDSTEEVVAPMVTRMIPVDEVVSVIKEVSGVSDTEPIGEVITEGTEVIEGTEIVIFSAVSDQVSVSSVIKEAFNEKLAKLKSINSVKAKVIGLQRHIANVVADQFIGRESNPNLGWLVHGWAMMQFDGIEEKQKMKRFSVSPVRIWADRVTRVARRVKDKFVRTYSSVYKQLFVAI